MRTKFKITNFIIENFIIKYVIRIVLLGQMSVQQMSL
jgi:hypothetical protein